MGDILPNIKVHRWLISFIVLSVCLALWPSLTRADDPAAQNVPTGHALVDLYGYPFLIPHEYFRGQVGRGSPSELALIASLPGVGPDGKSAQDEWAQGAPRMLLIGVFPPTLYTKVDKGNLFPEQVVANRINQLEHYRHDHDPPFRDIEFKQEWAALVEKHSDQKDQAVDATHLLGWDNIGRSPSERYKTVFVVFSEGRTIMYGRCGTQRPDRKEYYPHCTSYFQEPGSVFSFQLYYDAARQGNSLRIARQVAERIRAFNEAAIQASGTGKRAFSLPLEGDIDSGEWDGGNIR